MFGICNSVYSQLYDNHITGNGGCKKCNTHKNRESNQPKPIEQFIAEAKLIHEDNYNYLVSKYTGAHNKIEIACNKCDKVFWQTPSSHLKGIGCPKCASSKGEKLIFKILQENDIKFETQWHFNKHKDLRKTKNSSYLRFDFFLPDYNLCIEYDGGQHFKPIRRCGGIEGLLKIQQRDQVKDQFCLDNNIRSVRIPHWVKLTEELILQQLEEKFTIKSNI